MDINIGIELLDMVPPLFLQKRNNTYYNAFINIDNDIRKLIWRELKEEKELEAIRTMDDNGDRIKEYMITYVQPGIKDIIDIIYKLLAKRGIALYEDYFRKEPKYIDHYKTPFELLVGGYIKGMKRSHPQEILYKPVDVSVCVIEDDIKKFLEKKNLKWKIYPGVSLLCVIPHIKDTKYGEMIKGLMRMFYNVEYNIIEDFEKEEALGDKLEKICEKYGIPYDWLGIYTHKLAMISNTNEQIEDVWETVSKSLGIVPEIPKSRSQGHFHLVNARSY